MNGTNTNKLARLIVAYCDISNAEFETKVATVERSICNYNLNALQEARKELQEENDKAKVGEVKKSRRKKPKRSNRIWFHSEQKVLEKNYGNMNLRQLAKLLRRSPTAIRQRASNFGLTKRHK